MLQEIKSKYKKKSWLRICTLHSINKWDLIFETNEPVFPGKYYIKKAPPIANKNCLICNTEFSLGIYKNSFIAIKDCDCGKDGTNLATVDKLLPFYDRSTCEKIISSVHASRKKGLPNTVDYWVNKGLSIEEAETQIKKVQKSRSSRSPSAQPGAIGYTNRSIEYWIKKGYSTEDAKLKLKESQVRNGLKYYIKKFGEKEGTIRYNLRIEKWLTSPNNIKLSKGRSKKSTELFEKIGVGFFGDFEKTVRGKTKVHRVDFLFDKKIIEFFGDYWHGNPIKYSPTDLIRKKLVSSIWEHDKNKIFDLTENGYDVLVIWENDYCNDPDKILKLCKNFVYENHSTYC